MPVQGEAGLVQFLQKTLVQAAAQEAQVAAEVGALRPDLGAGGQSIAQIQPAVLQDPIRDQKRRQTILTAGWGRSLSNGFSAQDVNYFQDRTRGSRATEQHPS